MTNITKSHLGVDVSKEFLDFYIHPTGAHYKVENSAKAIRAFLKTLNQDEIASIVCEATGGYEKTLAKVLEEHGLNLWIVDPRRIKGFIISTGCKSKTDKIDAKKIAEFAARNTRDYIPVKTTQNHDQLQALIDRKGDLTKFLVAEKSRFQQPSHELSKKSIEHMIKALEKEIKAIEKSIGKLIEADQILSKKADLLESIPGIGKASAAALLVSIPELGMLSNKKISALAGLCPFDRQSGKVKGRSFIRGGRGLCRTMLYMCALTTIKYNLIFKNFYDRLIEKKPFKVAIVAVMHKLIILANTILKKGESCRV
jgi:transposase